MRVAAGDEETGRMVAAAAARRIIASAEFGTDSALPPTSASARQTNIGAAPMDSCKRFYLNSASASAP